MVAIVALVPGCTFRPGALPAGLPLASRVPVPQVDGMSENPVRIEVRLRELAQLFNSMDPSPFSERDLDGDAEEFIVSWARELPTHRTIELFIQLAVPPAPTRAAALEGAVRHFFAERASIKRLEFRQLMRRGRQSLLIGLIFLAGCILLGDLVNAGGAVIYKEGLTIVGWVAMWRPLEVYLYDWWPLRDEWRLLERLAEMKVTLVQAPAPPAPHETATDKGRGPRV